jgi:chaperone required for assembly of F1-ATPase
MSNENSDNPMAKAQEADRAPLPKRFYKSADVAVADGGGFVVQLDGRPVKTPKRRLLVMPERNLAEAIAGEWDAVVDVIDPADMPLTRLANTAIDGVADTMDAVAQDAARFAQSDLICYRAEGPEGLVDRQSEVWDPLIVWAREELGVRLNLAGGVMHVAQPPETLERAQAHLQALDAFKLTGLHVMTTLTGSLVIALAVARGRLSAEEAWAASLVDEDWQISQWGPDEEAIRRRQSNWLEMQAAARMASGRL